ARTERREELAERRVHLQELPVVVGGDEGALGVAEVVHGVRVEVRAGEPGGAGETAAPAVVRWLGEPRLVRLHVVHEEEDGATRVRSSGSGKATRRCPSIERPGRKPPARCAPWRLGYMPVKSDACAGKVHAAGERACVNSEASAANAVRFGDVSRA